MTIDPRIAALARQLGRLLRCYAPGEDNGHAAIEISAAFQEGYANNVPAEVATLRLPLRTAHPQSSIDVTHQIDAAGAVTLDVGSDYIHIATEKINAANVQRSIARLPSIGIILALDAAGDLRVHISDGGKGVDYVLKHLP